MIKRLALVLCLIPCIAGAQVIDKVTTATLSTSSGNCLQPNPLRTSLTLDNTGGSVDIGYCEMDPVPPGAAGTPCTAAIGSGGTSTLAATTNHYWYSGSAPTNGFCFIAASGTPSLTIREGM